MKVIQLNNNTKIKELPKFMIAENPIEKSGEFILHLREPKLLIKVFNLTNYLYKERESFVKNVPVGGSCEVMGDYYYFVPVQQYADFSNTPKILLETELAELMKECADWFASYVIWEYENYNKNL